jgi:hypothetical protein
MYKIHNAPWNAYCKGGKPLANLAGFVRGCSDDKVTRSMAATTTVLALAQIAGPSMLRRPPGFLLVNAGGLGDDPLAHAVKSMAGLGGSKPGGEPEDFERHRNWMIKQANDMIGGVKARTLTREVQAYCMGQFGQSRELAFGGERCGNYSRRHDPAFGWVTDHTNHLILTLESEDDHARFREDVVTGADKLLRPSGFRESLDHGPKTLSIAGSVPAAHLETQLVDGIIIRALPIVFLPHVADGYLKMGDPLALSMIAVGLETEARDCPHTPVTPDLRVMGTPWFQGCLARLRQRLGLFPDGYEFFVRQLLLELGPCCERLACMVAMDGSSLDDCCALFLDLQALTFHGICLSIESLGWHCYGFDPGGDREEALKILAVIRGEGTISRRDMLRKLQWLTAENRDTVLERFEHEGLVTTTGRQVAAVSFADYFRAIPAKAGIEAPALLWGLTPHETATMAGAN